MAPWGRPGLWDNQIGEREEGLQDSGTVFKPSDHKLVHLRKGPALEVGQNSFILMIYAMLTELLGSMRLCCVIFTRTNSFHPHNNLGGRDFDCCPPWRQIQRQEGSVVPLVLGRWLRE